jgi:hypothetical protein
MKAARISKGCRQAVEQTSSNALQRSIERMEQIMADVDYMSRLTEAALEQCIIRPGRRCHSLLLFHGESLSLLKRATTS